MLLLWKCVKLTIFCSRWLTKTFGSHTQENTEKVPVNAEFVLTSLV